MIVNFFEPIFFPKFQIYFADFPYLLYFIRLEAFHLGDLMRFIVRTNQKGKYMQDLTPTHMVFPLIFKDQLESTR